MAQIYITSIIATIASVVVWGTFFRLMAGPYRRMAWLAAITLPFSVVVNLWIKRPLASLVATLAGVGTGLSATAPLWFLVFAHFLAPVTEEAIKLAPALLPTIRRRIDSRPGAVWAGMWLGMGFGIGELWLIAWSVAQTPALAGYPWWQYTGFLTERLVTVYAHGVMTAVAVYGIALGPRKLWLTCAAAVGLHALVNAGAMLYQLGLIAAGWSQALLLLSLLLLTFVFQRLLRVAGALGHSAAAATSPQQEGDEQ